LIHRFNQPVEVDSKDGAVNRRAIKAAPEAALFHGFL
jgi:hypothetical protein